MLKKKNFFIGSGIIIDLEQETQPLRVKRQSFEHREYCILEEGGFRMWSWCYEKRELTMATWML